MPVVDSDAFRELNVHDKDLLARQQINFAIDSDAKIKKSIDDAIRRYEVALNYVSDSEDALPKALMEKAGEYFQRMRFLKDLQQQFNASATPPPVEMSNAEIASAIAVTTQQRALNVDKKYEISKKVATGGAQVTKQVGGVASWLKKNLPNGSRDGRSTGSAKVMLFEDESPIVNFDDPCSNHFMPSSLAPESSKVIDAAPWASRQTDILVTDSGQPTITQGVPFSNSGVFEIGSDSADDNSLRLESLPRRDSDLSLNIFDEKWSENV